MTFGQRRLNDGRENSRLSDREPCVRRRRGKRPEKWVQQNGFEGKKKKPEAIGSGLGSKFKNDLLLVFLSAKENKIVHVDLRNIFLLTIRFVLPMNEFSFNRNLLPLL